jgi:hypothetical protein
MKQAERDELAERQVVAVEEQTRVMRDFVHGLLADHRTEQEQELRAPYPPPFRLLAGPRGVTTLARSLPGFAGLWEVSVPPSHLMRAQGRGGAWFTLILCPDGAQTVLEENVTECSDGCGRWYLPVGESVRVKRFDEAEDAAA